MKKGLALSKRSESNGFTLVELLIVMGVLAVLVVTILVSLNPAEAQKKARDVQRIKDAATIEAIILQWIQDGNPPIPLTATCPNYEAGNARICNSLTTGAGIKSQPCDNNWITGTSTPNLCNYTKTIPVDPRNGQNTTFVCVPNSPYCSSSGIWVPDNARYVLQMKGGDYKIWVYQESKSNIDKIANDGGNSSVNYEVGSSPDAMTNW